MSRALAQWKTEDDRPQPFLTYRVYPTGYLEEEDAAAYDQEISQAYVVVYRTERAYGGPEEGGWTYAVGTPEAAIPISTKEQEAEARALLIKLFELDHPRQRRSWGSPVYEGPYLEAEWPQPYPAQRPHYE